jgi:hypothetical protein
MREGDRYIQWILSKVGQLRVEVSSNEVLEAAVVSPDELVKLQDMGVAVHNPDPNYVYESATADVATELIVRILRDVFEIQPEEIGEIDLG